MSDIKFRLTFNAIGLAYTAYQAANALLIAFDKSSSVFPFTFALFAVFAFGCVLSAIDYAKGVTK